MKGETEMLLKGEGKGIKRERGKATDWIKKGGKRKRSERGREGRLKTGKAKEWRGLAYILKREMD